MKILLIEDDLETAAYVREGLSAEGHEIEISSNGRDGLLQATSGTWDLLIIDRMLPEFDGLSIVRTLRSVKAMTPVLFLSTMGGLDDRVAGLNAGADDYLVKPFALVELAARVQALGRRPRPNAPETLLKVADLEMHLLSRRVFRAGQEIDLQPREFRLLEYLMQNTNRVVTRTMLLEQVWDYHFDPRTNVVESHVSRLRSKVDKGQPVELIHTVRGAGYCLRDPG